MSTVSLPNYILDTTEGIVDAENGGVGVFNMICFFVTLNEQSNSKTIN